MTVDEQGALNIEPGNRQSLEINISRESAQGSDEADMSNSYWPEERECK